MKKLTVRMVPTTSSGTRLDIGRGSSPIADHAGIGGLPIGFADRTPPCFREVASSRPNLAEVSAACRKGGWSTAPAVV